MIREWLIKYWLEVGCGLIVSILGLGFRWVIKTLKNEYHEQREKFFNEIDKKLEAQKTEMAEKLEAQRLDLIDLLNDRLAQQDAQLLKADEMVKQEMEPIRQELDVFRSNVSILQKGIRSIHTKSFKRECRKLLDTDHIITQSEQEDIDNEFQIYVELGGDPADPLYAHVKSKYESGFKNAR